MRILKKSINAWTVDAKTNFDEMFSQLSACGFSAVELNIDRDGDSMHSLSMGMSKSELLDIRRKAEENGMSISGVSTSLYGNLLCSDNPKECEKGKEIIRKQIFCAKCLDTDSVLIVPGADIAGGADIDNAYNNAFELLCGMKEEIEEQKIYVCLENVWNAFFTSAYDMRNFIDRLNSPYIKAYYDVGNTVAFSDTASWINILGERIKRIHIKDFKRGSDIFGGLNTGGEFVDLTEGDVDWKKVMKALKKTGYNSYLTAEVFPTKEYADMTDYYKKVSDEEDKILKLEELI